MDSTDNQVTSKKRKARRDREDEKNEREADETLPNIKKARVHANASLDCRCIPVSFINTLLEQVANIPHDLHLLLHEGKVNYVSLYEREDWFEKSFEASLTLASIGINQTRNVKNCFLLLNALAQGESGQRYNFKSRPLERNIVRALQECLFPSNALPDIGGEDVPLERVSFLRLSSFANDHNLLILGCLRAF